MADSPLDRLLEQGVDFETIEKRLECGISISEQEAAHRAPLDGFYELCDLTDEERQPPEFIVDGFTASGADIFVRRSKNPKIVFGSATGRCCCYRERLSRQENAPMQRRVSRPRRFKISRFRSC